MYASICLQVSRGIHQWIYLLCPIILCFADGMCKPTQCLRVLFSSPQFQQTGEQMIILWTHYSVWSSYHDQPSWVSNLGSAKLCSVHNVAFVSALPCFCFRLHVCARRGSWKEKTVTEEREPQKGMSMHICKLFSGDILPQDKSVGGSVLWEHRKQLAEASSLSTFSSHLCREPLIVSHRVRALLMPQSHADSSTCLEHYTVGELGQLSKMSRSLPLQGMQHNASLLSWKHIKH